jgi:hypothetical protein
VIDLGDTVPLAVEITDGQGEPTNASSVVLTITLPDGTALDPAPVVTNPVMGRYEFDYVPTVAGLHVVRWASTNPATAFADVIDVRAAGEVSVVSLADAKRHLNKSAQRVDDDEELRGVLVAAVERVERHVGRELAGSVSPAQRLAVLEVLAEFWSSQRTRLGGRGLGRSDVDDEFQRPLEMRLADLLGPATAPSRGVPQGVFPVPSGWPE